MVNQNLDDQDYEYEQAMKESGLPEADFHKQRKK